MRACWKLNLVCLLVLSAISGRGEEIQETPGGKSLGLQVPKCVWFDNLLQKLEKRTPPQSSDVPVESDKMCGEARAYDQRLAVAAAAFIVFPREDVEPLAEVLEIIKEAHEKEVWQTNYLKFSQDLETRLRSSSFEFSIPNSAIKAEYNALDRFIRDLQNDKYPRPSPCAANIALAARLQNDYIPVRFVPAKECPSAYYSDLSKALAPLVLRDLRNKTSRTASFIASIRKSLAESSQATDLRDFTVTLREELKTLGVELPVAKNGDADTSLDLLVNKLENPDSGSGAFVLLALWSLTLANTVLLAYMIRRSRPPKSSPNPIRYPAPAALATSPDKRDQFSAHQPRTLAAASTSSKDKQDQVSALQPRTEAVEQPFAKLETTSVFVNLRERVERLEEDYADVATQKERWNSKLSGMEGRPPGPQPLSTSDQAGANLDIRILKEQMKELKNTIRQVSESLVTSAGSPIDLERKILGESWRKFREHKDLVASIERASNDQRWKEIRDPLLFQLPQAVPEDLKATFDAILAPARDFHNLITKISLIPRLVVGDLPRLESDAQELTRLREFAHLLAMTLNSNLVADRLNFRLERWITDQFLSFADLFVQRYQQAQLENREAPLETGLQIVRQVLKVANLEPIELILGKTVFDSTKHIGRSTTCDPRFSDGVVMGAVRNGFVQGGQQVLRQPEVIVNRIR